MIITVGIISLIIGYITGYVFHKYVFHKYLTQATALKELVDSIDAYDETQEYLDIPNPSDELKRYWTAVDNARNLIK